jgi:hypothetical protein
MALWEAHPDIEILNFPSSARGLKVSYLPPIQVTRAARDAKKEGLKEPLMLFSDSVAWTLNESKWNAISFVSGTDSKH